VIPITADNPDHLEGGRWSADSTYLAAYGLNPGDLFYLPLQQGQSGGKQVPHQLAVPDGADGTVESITCVATNSTSLSPGLAAGMLDGSIYLWDFQQNARPVRKLDTNGIAQAAQSIGWSPDGRWLAASFSDQHTSILVWKLV
jgi:WD40 repeat protein